MKKINMEKGNRKKVIAVIQARIASRRLPEKVLKTILDKTLIGWVNYRLSFAKEIDGVVVGTSDNPENIKIAHEADRLSIPYYRGSESDLISRYLDIAKKFDADAVVRICGDCPLVDPEIVDRLVKKYRENPESDFICNNTPPTFPHGMDVEVIPRKTLEKIDSSVDNPLYREWLTMNIVEHPDKYNIVNVENESPMRDLRLTVDYPEDLELVREVFEKLHQDGKIFNLKDIQDLFDREPALRDINSKWLNTKISDNVRVNKEFQELKKKNG